jgi:dipeptidyl aminopeptidase/acylaminoacyl peptidase
VDLHGGPALETGWAYDAIVQHLANRGYTVLQLDYHGSSGRGTTFEATAGQVLAGTAIDDVIDAISWAIEKGYAVRGRIGILGQSFGGYLAGSVAMRRPHDIACVASWAGAYDLLGLAERDQERTNSPLQRALSAYTFGDSTSPADRSKLLALSPTSNADRLSVPLFMFFGAHDGRIPPDEAVRFAKALQISGNRPIAVRFDDASHGYWPDVDIVAIMGLIENFFSTCLGGRALPLNRAEIERSSMHVLSDNGMISGLKNVLPASRYSASLLEGSPAESIGVGVGGRSQTTTDR